MTDEEVDSIRCEITRRYGEDAASHALLRLVEKGMMPGEGHKPRHFALVCARHYMLDQVAHQARERVGDKLLDRPEYPGMPAQESRLLLGEAVRTLDPTLILPALGYTEVEVAQMLQIQPGTVKSRRHRRRGKG